MTLMLFYGLGATASPVRQQQQLDVMFDFEQQQVLQIPVGVHV